MGLHTRIDETMRTVISKAHVGNLYINRNIVGAVVGVQPLVKVCLELVLKPGSTLSTV